MKPPASRSSAASGVRTPVLQAAAFKAEALAVMRRVQETGRPVMITSRGKPLVRIEPVGEPRPRAAYGSMRGTVEFLVPDDDLVSARSRDGWGTLREWGKGSKR
jgi:prevent-host-death family protein